MKLLIADDEEYSREGIRDSIDWNVLGIDEIMLATDGNEALSIARWFVPDIIITDIKMPHKDGIAFADEIVKSYPDCRLLFISGYVETAYFKSALQLGVIDYIVKPINKGQLRAAVGKAVDIIRRQQRIREITIDNQEMKKSRLLQGLLCTKPDEVWLERMCQETGFPRKGHFHCMIIRYTGSVWQDMELRKRIDDVMKSGESLYLLDFVREVGYVCIAECSRNIWQQRIQELLQDEKVILGTGVDIGRLSAIYQSYISAQRAVELGFFEPDRRLLELGEEMLSPRNLDPGLYNQFTGLLKKSPRELRSWFETLITEIQSSGQYRRENIVAMFISLVQYILNEKKGIADMLDGIQGAADVADYIGSMHSFAELTQFVWKVLDALDEEQNRKNGYSRIVQSILAYIEERYADNSLSVAEIADYEHLSVTYLNILFKKDMQVTLKQYISNYRMDKAKKLLRGCNLRIGDIAEKCGYADANYFTRVFKECEDMTPVEYRENRNL